MGKVKVIKSYKDLQKMLLFHPGEVHEVDEKRAAELVQKKLVEIQIGRASCRERV